MHLGGSVIVGYPAATNLVPNGGFETNATGYVANGGTATQSTDFAKFGTHSLKMTGKGVYIEIDGSSHALTAVSASLTYTGSVYIYSAAGMTGTLYLVRQKNDYSSDGNAASTAVTIPAAAWTRFSVSGAGTANTAYMYMLLDLATTQTNYLDGVQIELGGAATPYIDTSAGAASRTATTLYGLHSTPSHLGRN